VPAAADEREPDQLVLEDVAAEQRRTRPLERDADRPGRDFGQLEVVGLDLLCGLRSGGPGAAGQGERDAQRLEGRLLGCYPGAVKTWMAKGTILTLAICNSTCGNPLDLCPPIENRVGFFSRGDCMLTRASFFSGHEWLTFLGNADLPENARFSEGEIAAIVEGNRRVDWPKELMVHLNVSALAYFDALLVHTNRAEVQPSHFLLDDRNDTPTAAQNAYHKLQELTKTAVRDWVPARDHALAAIGQACHMVQDAYSPAHARRDEAHPIQPWCVVKIKAFAPRAAGFDSPDIEYHGVDEGFDQIGHTTVQDSIYREGRECHDPKSREEVEGCLSETARRAQLATRDYLDTVLKLIRDNADPLRVESGVSQYIDRHLRLCSEL
jgi:hypothetical protein